MYDTLTFMYNLDRKEILECIAYLWKKRKFLIHPSLKYNTYGMSQVWTSQVWIMFTWSIKKIVFFIVVLDLVQLRQELVGFFVLLHGYYFFVLLFCSFFNISFVGVIGLLLQFVFYIIDFFAVFVLFVDCAFYSWIILIAYVFCNGICWLIMVFVNFVVLFLRFLLT